MLGAKQRINQTTYDVSSIGEITVTDKDDIAVIEKLDTWIAVKSRTPVNDVRVNAHPYSDKPDYKSMKKSDLVHILEYRQIDFKSTQSKAELIKLIESEV